MSRNQLEELSEMVVSLMKTDKIIHKKSFLWKSFIEIDDLGFIVSTSQKLVPRMTCKVLTFFLCYGRIGLIPLFLSLFVCDLPTLVYVVGNTNSMKIFIRGAYVLFHLATLINVSKGIESTLELRSYTPSALVLSCQILSSYL